jgi:dTDP-D-glucose 4,6-dehydratase
MWILDELDLSPLTTFHYKTIDKDFHFDISKAKSDLEWEPEDSNADCMIRGYDWYTNNEVSNENIGEGHRKSPDQGILRLLRKVS